MPLWALSHLLLGKFRLWWQSTDSNSLKGKGCDKIEHGNTRNHSLLPLPFNTNSILITFSSVHPGMFCQWYKVPRESLTSVSSVNSVGIRYTLERKDLTDYKKKIILRNTEILSIPHEIGSILIVCARDHKFICLGVGPQMSHSASEERHLHRCSKDHHVSPPSCSLQRLLELLSPIAKHWKGLLCIYQCWFSVTPSCTDCKLFAILLSTKRSS